MTVRLGLLLAGAVGCLILAQHPAHSQTAGIVQAGFGATGASTHQLVRTSAGIPYVFAGTCPGIYPCGNNQIVAYAGSAPGVSPSYTLQDAAHEPSGTITSTSEAIAIDGNNRIHVAWLDQAGNGHASYAIFDTTTNTWGPTIAIQTTYFQDGALPTPAGISLSLDANGNPYVVWSSRGTSSSAPVRLWYSKGVAGKFSRPVPIDGPTKPATSLYAFSPTSAFTANGDFVVAWLQGALTTIRDDAWYTPGGTIFTRTLSAAGSFGPVVKIHNNAMTSIDDNPSLYISADGTQHIAFESGATGHEDEIRYWYNTGSGWRGDRQPPAQVTHDPSVGPDGAGGIRIYGHGAPPPPDYSGVGKNLYFFAKPANGQWSAWTEYDSGDLDCAVSTRWSQFFYYHPEYTDIAFWADPTSNNMPYQAFSLFVGTTQVSSSVLLGTNTIQPTIDGNAAGTAEAFRYVASSSGEVARLGAYVDSTNLSGNIVLGLYSDASGQPGSLLATGSIANPQRGAFNEVTVPSTAIGAGNAYWIAILGAAGQGNTGFRDQVSGTQPSTTSQQSDLTALPSSWTGSGQTWQNSPASAYAVGQ